MDIGQMVSDTENFGKYLLTELYENLQKNRDNKREMNIIIYAKHEIKI